MYGCSMWVCWCNSSSRPCQAVFLISSDWSRCASAARFSRQPQSVHLQHCRRQCIILPSDSTFLLPKLSTSDCCWLLLEKSHIETFPLLWESLCRMLSSVFGTLTETEKTLQFGLMWEEVRKAFSRPLSAVSAWNRAACVGSMSYLHTGIWILNDTNITAF